MRILSKRIIDQSAMTLVEILVSLVILGLVLMAVFPLVTQSLQVTNLSNTISSQLFRDQENLEIVAATKGGVLFADGTFLANKYFPVFFSSQTPVQGMTVKKAKLIRFLASIPHVAIEDDLRLYEGYTAEEAKINILGYGTNFINTSKTVLKVTDKNGNDLTSYCSDYNVVSTTEVTFTLPSNSNRFTNLASPYTITLTTGSEQVSCLLLIHLPRAIAIQENGNTLVSSNAINWVSKSTNPTINRKVNKLAVLSKGEDSTRFVAVGDGGSIFVWSYNESWQKLNHNLTTQNLNNIIRTDDLFVAVGNNGVILTSPDGLKWTKKMSNTIQNLHSVAYSPISNSYICVGGSGVILVSSDAINWTQQHIYPRLVTNAINGQKAVEFSGNGDYLNTLAAPVTGDTSRTVIMVASPRRLASNLLSWGSPLATIDGGRFTFGIDDEGKLRIEQGYGIGYSADLLPNLTGEPSLMICRSSSSNFESYRLSMNGENPDNSNVSASIDTSGYFPAQLGSDALTRYTDPMNFKGMIAEVLVFDCTVNAARNSYPDDNTKHYASDLDLLRKYLSDKYGLVLNSLDGTNIADLIDPVSKESLSNITFNSFPAGVSQDNLVLWLDASNPDSLEIGNNDQVLLWKDLSAEENHAQGAALYSLACSTDRTVAGGYHRNILSSVNTVGWNQTHQLDAKRATEYSLIDMIYSGSNFVALVNDGLSSFTSISNSDDRENGLIAYSTNGINWRLKDLSSTSNYIMNDMFLSPNSRTILVVGDHGSMFTSSDNGENWDKITLSSTTNLLAACMR